MAVRANVEVQQAVRQLLLELDDLDAASFVPDWQGRFVRAWAFVDRWRQQVQSALPPPQRAWTVRPRPDEYEQYKMKLRNGSLASSATLLGACHAALVGAAPITFGDHEVDGTVLRIRPRARNGARSHGDLLGHLCPAVTATRLDVVDGLLLDEMTFFDPDRPLFEAGEAVRVLAWPIWPDHPGLRDALEPHPNVHLLARDGREGDTARVSDPANHAGLCEQIDAALAEARSRSADILLLPKLTHSPALVKHLQTQLRASAQAHPRLVIAGVEHQPVDASAQRFVNEAVVVDATGKELTRYRKLQEFYLAPLGAGERLDLGDRVLLLSTFAGTFAAVICIDCFAAPVKQRIRASWTSVILVPSMSPKTSAHRAAAADLAGDGFQMVVANWWLDGPLAGPLANRRTWAAKGEAVHRAANSFARSMPGGNGEHDPDEVSGQVLHVCYPNGT